MRRVLFIMHMPPPVHGSSVVGKNIHDSEIIRSAFECEYVNLMLASSLDDLGHYGFKKLKRYIGIIKETLSKMRSFKPDVVYVTPTLRGGAFKLNYVIIQLLKCYNCKIIIHCHNKGVEAHQDGWLHNFLYKRFFKGISAIVLTDGLYNDIKKYVKREDAYTCSNGIPLDEKVPGYLASKMENKRCSLLYLSNMMAEKGVYILLEALAEVFRERKDFDMHFVGGWTDVTEDDFVKRCEELGLNYSTLTHPNDNAQVIAHGPKYGDDKIKMMIQADAFVFPTFYSLETLPLSVLEAMQFALPIISTNEGGVPDVVIDGDNGFVCEKRSVPSLVNALNKLLALSAEDRKKMGQNGRDKYLAKYTKTAFENRLKEILETL